MTNVQHNALTGSSLHDNKGVSAATDNTVATAVSGATVWAKLTASNLTTTGNPFGGQLFQVQDEKTSGTAPGTFTSGAWRTRTLNTVKTNEITSASLAANVISLPTGTYHVRARAPSFQARNAILKLVNTTNATDLVLGGGSYSNSAGNYSSVDSWLEGRFTISGTKNIELQHQCSSSGDFGSAHSLDTEIFAQVWIWKIG